MTCEYFNTCGSCNLAITYEKQLDFKLQREKKRFSDFYTNDIDIIQSEEQHFRSRAEFRVFHIDNSISYAMNDVNKKLLCIDSCPIVDKSIYDLMPKLLEAIKDDEILCKKFFSVEFLSSLDGQVLVTMIYHKKLDEAWEEKAKELEKKLNIYIIGRSRKQKVILTKDYIEEKLPINNDTYNMVYHEGSFTQPNTKTNIKMIQWVIDNINEGGDLCELYCGAGNFTIPLSKKFDKVLATEISKTSIRAAIANCELNNVSNINFIRMSSEEFVEALNDVREFRRLKDVNLDDYNFKNKTTSENKSTTIFVDPPRAGLDETTTKLVKDFNQIIYISCNPETLHRDLIQLNDTHEIKHFALFDQFVYSKHIECGAVLYKRD
jgi:tRNA (uracil-5-)-methyltransferase